MTTAGGKVLYLVPLVGALLFGLVATPLARAAWNALGSRSWPTVPATVQASQWRQFTGKGCRYTLDLRYAYVVDGVSFVGDRYRFGGECGAEVVSIAQAHPVGSRVPVHYDPAHPARSVVEAGDLSGNTELGLALTSFMMLLCLGAAWRQRLRP